ncbi:unnamed protein product [Zymoseptoria tritici ST99CH_1A5]|nr:unnamed protein product [Zymoseptoria tritici ST99CH_1A5]
MDEAASDTETGYPSLPTISQITTTSQHILKQHPTEVWSFERANYQSANTPCFLDKRTLRRDHGCSARGGPGGLHFEFFPALSTLLNELSLYEIGVAMTQTWLAINEQMAS